MYLNQDKRPRGRESIPGSLHNMQNNWLSTVTFGLCILNNAVLYVGFLTQFKSYFLKQLASCWITFSTACKGGTVHSLFNQAQHCKSLHSLVDVALRTSLTTIQDGDDRSVSFPSLYPRDWAPQHVVCEKRNENIICAIAGTGTRSARHTSVHT